MEGKKKGQIMLLLDWFGRVHGWDDGYTVNWSVSQRAIRGYMRGGYLHGYLLALIRRQAPVRIM